MGNPYLSQKAQAEAVVDATHRGLDIERAKRKAERNKRKGMEAYKKLPFLAKMAFFCVLCNEDFVVPAYKVWSNLHRLGTWHSFCPFCESPVYRHITQKIHDPYYEHSNKNLHMRSAFARDTLQPHQYGFKTLYGDPYEKMWKMYQEKEEDIYSKYAAFGLAGKDLAQQDEEREIQEEMEEIYL